MAFRLAASSLRRLPFAAARPQWGRSFTAEVAGPTPTRGRFRSSIRRSILQMRSKEAKTRFAKNASSLRRRLGDVAIVGTVAFSIYSVLSESAHRRRIIGQYETGTGPATNSNLREFLGDNVGMGDNLHDEEPPGPIREALNNYLQQHGISESDIPKLLTMVAGLKYVAYGLTMLISVRFRPIQRIFRWPGPRRLVDRAKKRWPQTWETWEKRIFKAADSLAQTRVFKWLAIPLRQNPESIAMGLAEGLVL